MESLVKSDYPCLVALWYPQPQTQFLIMRIFRCIWKYWIIIIIVLKKHNIPQSRFLHPEPFKWVGDSAARFRVLLKNKMAKFALRMPSRCSNIGCRGELGRCPLSVSILTSVLKYYSRLINCQKNTLLYEALTSQHLTTFKSRKTMTYIDFTKRVLDYGNLDVSGITSKYQRNKFGRKTKQFLEKKYKCVFFDILQSSSKLELYSNLKRSFCYEQYLHQGNFSALTKIRLSSHWKRQIWQFYSKRK